ncbi:MULTISPECIES: hypothetical protein [unclassified Microbacterium]|uniref:hypothetical protein n=1 Tax=unclassified Microbacterium TaxID=2609290 RepID=UPI0030100B63
MVFPHCRLCSWSRFGELLNPDDAGEGFPQIPYQEAIEAMGRAADTGDVDSMRGIWNDELKAMFRDPVVIDQIQNELDSGDLTVLSQMFS